MTAPGSLPQAGVRVVKLVADAGAMLEAAHWSITLWRDWSPRRDQPTEE